MMKKTDSPQKQKTDLSRTKTNSHQVSVSLLRGLSLRNSVALLVGTIIGTGIFLKTGPMSQWAGSPYLVLVAWLVAGVLSLMGGIIYAELGSLFPRAGGEYIYLREAFGYFPAFLFGWMRFWIASPGSIAAFAVGAVTFLNASIYWAIFFIMLFSMLNCFQVAWVGKFQTAITTLKITLILVLSILIFCYSQTGSWDHLLEVGSDLLITPEGTQKTWFNSISWTGFGAAILSALWAFDGWNNLSMAGGEIKNPQKAIPQTLTIGLLIVLGIYAFVNLSYFYALSWDQILNINTGSGTNIAAQAFKTTLMSPLSSSLVSFLMAISALGAMNGSILTSARVPFAMAQDRIFPIWLGKVSPSTHVPIRSVMIQGLWASLLALLGSFEQLTNSVVFASWIFYALCVVGLFRFRSIQRRDGMRQSKESHFQVPFYPFLPILFLVITLILLLNTLWTSTKESLLGLLLLIPAVPIYYLFYSHSHTKRVKS